GRRGVVGAIIAEHTKAFAHEIHHGTPESITKAAKRWFMLPKLLFGHANLRGGKRGNAQLTTTLFRQASEIREHREAQLWGAVLDSAPPPLRARRKTTAEHDVMTSRKLVEAGAVGKATRVLREALEIAGDELTLQAAPQLFPHHQPQPPAAYDEQDDEQQQFELHFAKALRAAPKRSAVGPDGWRYEHFQLVQTDLSALCALATVAAALARGTLSQEVQGLATAARLLPLTRSPTRIRPINLASPLRRLASKAVNKMAADEVAEGLRGKQFGYKHTAGAELVHKRVSTALHVRPDYAVLSLGAADAFQKLSRVYINEGIDAHCPKLRRWARGFLPDAGQVVYHDTGGRIHIWNQTTGIFQGCGMATTLFCLGLDRALERAKHQFDAAGVQHELFGYIDDLTILARPEDLPTIYATYTNALSQAGDMAWRMRAAGVPAQTATQLDAGLLSTLEDLVQTHDLTAEQKEKCWHPVALGGLGFQSVSAVRLDAQAASWALCEKPVRQRLGLRDTDDLLRYCPGLRPALHRLQCAVDALTQEEAARQAPGAEPPDTTQRCFTRHRRHAEWTQWLRRTQTEPHQRAWALSATGKGAGAWLGPPTRPDHHLADAHFRMAVRRRLGGLVRAADGPCPFRKEDGTLCAGTVDTNGRHALCCSYGGFMVRRDNLRDTVARALREAGICDIAVERWIRPPAGPGNPGLRADLRCTDSGGQWADLDLAIVHPASQQSLQAGGAHAQGTAARLAEQAKRRKYNRVAGFQPLGFEVSGAMGESTRKWLAQQVPGGPGRQETLSTLHRPIAACVVREVARTLISAA
ncbi:unnamed protein product, partial [Prorocentrum cordatum]